MSLVLLGILNSQVAGGGKYWLSSIDSATGHLGGYMAIDSADNLYLASTNYESSNYDAYLAKMDNAGSIQWQRELSGAAVEFIEDVATDSSGNAYFVGRTTSEGAGSDDVLLAKYNSSGTLQWQRVLGDADSNVAYSITVDSSGNVYVAGRQYVSGTFDFESLLAKYDSSGTIQWQRSLATGVADQDVVAYGVTTDSAGNVYMTGYTGTNVFSSHIMILVKYNSSGTIQWQRTLKVAFLRFAGYATNIDSSGNVYVTGFGAASGAGNDTLSIVKYNSSGTLQWQKYLGEATLYTLAIGGVSVAFDSLDNVYVTGVKESGTYYCQIAKFDSSGTLQWQRSLDGFNRDYAYSVGLDSNDDLYIAGRTNSTSDSLYKLLTAKLPSDGSLTGTYTLDSTDFTYSATSLVTGNLGATDSAGSLTGGTPTNTSTATTLTSSSITLTQNIVKF